MSTKTAEIEQEEKKELNISFKVSIKDGDLLAEGYRSANAAAKQAVHFWPAMRKAAIRELTAHFSHDQLDEIQNLSLPDTCDRETMVAIAEANKLTTITINRLRGVSRLACFFLIDMIQQETPLKKTI